MIRIKNIYYMLSYAFQSLNDKTYKKIETEDFENTAELFSEILVLGVSKQIKQGLVRDYIDITETSSSIHGKINITTSINEQSFIKKQLNCTYDEFSPNCYLNQIIKSTMQLLLKSNISPERKKKLKNLLMYFQDVDLIDLKSINWKIRFDRNNQTYRMLIGICYLAINGLLQTQNNGDTKLMEFLDDQRMSRLYEKFILNYYDKEHHYLNPSPSRIDWQIENGYDNLLPRMITDVTLQNENKILIIDAKFYKYNTSDNDTHHSHNLYQIFTYVKNKQEQVKENGIKVSGILLYAKTTKTIQPDSDYVMGGNKISVKTLDLNQEFSEIKNQLDRTVDDYFKCEDNNN